MPTLQSINASASPEVQMNQNFYAVAAAALFGRKDSTTAGLTLGYYGGIIGGIGTFATIADGTVALTGSATNYIEATTAGVVSANTTAFTAGRQPLYTAVTSSTAITTLTDYRVILPSMSTGSVTYSTLTLATGTITADTPALSITQTWNNAGVNFIAADTNITNTASGASSMLHRWRVGGAVKASIDYLGAMVLAASLAIAGGTALATTNQTGTGSIVMSTSPAITTSLTSPSTTFTLLATPTTVNFAQGASTALNIGHASGTNAIAGATTFSQAASGLSFTASGGSGVPISGSTSGNIAGSFTSSNAAGPYVQITKTSGGSASVILMGSSTQLIGIGTIVDAEIRANVNLYLSAAGGTVAIASEGAVSKFSVATATGNTLVAGTLGVTGALTTNGGLQTFLANDSAGAGFRYVVVPNA